MDETHSTAGNRAGPTRALADSASVLKRNVRELWRASVDILMPPSCALCGGPDPQTTAPSSIGNRVVPAALVAADFCPGCDLALFGALPGGVVLCGRCGMPRPSSDPSLDLPCRACQSTRYDFDHVYALGIYHDALREAVIAAKRSKHAELAVALGRRIGQQCLPATTAGHLDCVVGTPSHWFRRWKRGGLSGVERITRAVAQSIDRPYRPLLRTVRLTRKQGMLSDEERKENVRGAFAIHANLFSRPSPKITGLRILLVDDVLTTGSTASEAARVLKDAGAASVWLAVVARAVRST